MSSEAEAIVLGELRRLRARKMPLSPESIVGLDTLVFFAGRGKPELVIEGLRALWVDYEDNPSVRAALSTLGVHNLGDNVENRFNEFAVKYEFDTGKSIESRTVRRWSDAGLKMLARKIVQSSPRSLPVLHLVLSDLDGEGIKVEVELEEPNGIEMGVPYVEANGKELSVDDLPITLDLLDRVLRAHITVAWFGDAPARYWVEGLLSDLTMSVHSSQGLLQVFLFDRP